ncbi:hypothetical protein SAMIE_1004150 [Sphingobium amiense]|uniref:Uncharacterized protein n=2 Tax=Sphingobium amiense TaxID=135719 RepID=A0A494VWY8_9SPHN|nr:hypothetical protein [Sphingobium amiense]BBD96914.1 hypothetical protein SAMIE_1004150 [Sphingobium amiense]
MIDVAFLEWLAPHTESFQLRSNPQHDSHTTVARHILHRDRVGEPLQFCNSHSRRAAIEGESLWELSVRHLDGSATHFGAPSLEQCLAFARARLAPTALRAIAA